MTVHLSMTQSSLNLWSNILTRIRKSSFRHSTLNIKKRGVLFIRGDISTNEKAFRLLISLSLSKVAEVGCNKLIPPRESCISVCSGSAQQAGRGFSLFNPLRRSRCAVCSVHEKGHRHLLFSLVFFFLSSVFFPLSLFFFFFFEGVVMMGYSRREETGIGAARSGTS